MGNKNNLVFFSSFEDIGSSSNFLEFKTNTYTFIEIKEQRKQKRLVKRLKLLWLEEDQNEKILKYIQVREDMVDRASEMEKFLIVPVIKDSQKYSIPIIYINPQSYTDEWSNRIRAQGGIVHQFWDRPVNCMEKICNYAEFRRKAN